MTHVVFRPEAIIDLQTIALFVAQQSVPRAVNTVERLRRRCRILESHPPAGRLSPEIADRLRSLVERPYVVFYRITGDDAEVVAIVHAMRDLPAALHARLMSEQKS
ncbi:MAG: type II toxin-antitoxin system RelE/ParE family toxin [Alphaproteobacteria bacterium]|nr:type II toxin-antitoxin system RelE/ParE family toxin [Alphaproteobacteria bacterium]